MRLPDSGENQHDTGVKAESLSLADKLTVKLHYITAALHPSNRDG